MGNGAGCLAQAFHRWRRLRLYVAPAFGDWQVIEDEETSRWWRLSNYGVFHCAFVLREASERDDLDMGEFRYAFLVSLGTTTTREGKTELWALQIGVRPGSEYILLSRPAGRSGGIGSFTVLQRQCPASTRRKGPSLDSWRTDYCLVETRGQLVALATRMAKLPPLATATLVPLVEVDKTAK